MNLVPLPLNSSQSWQKREIGQEELEDVRMNNRRIWQYPVNILSNQKEKAFGLQDGLGGPPVSNWSLLEWARVQKVVASL